MANADDGGKARRKCPINDQYQQLRGDGGEPFTLPG
jgi:hypothetical protein